MNKKLSKKIETYMDEEVKKMQERFDKKIPKIVNDDPFIMYHGTSSTNFKKIKTQGIKPRGRKKSNFTNIGISRKDLVYLTNCYACYYAFTSAKTKKEKEVILKVKVDPKKLKLYLDEEFLYHALGYNRADNSEMAKQLYGTINPKKLSPIIKSRFKKKVTWKDSINFMGTVSCEFIPPEAIIGYAVLDKHGIYQCDPAISPMNYKVCAGMYISYLESLKYKKL